MPIEEREPASVVTHPLAREVLTELRDASTDRQAFREGLERLGTLCGHELLADRFDTEPATVETPLGTTTGERVAGGEDVVLVGVLRAALPFVAGLQSAFPTARQGFVSASRDETTPRGPDGTFSIAVEYVSLPDVGGSDTVIVADPMLATGSTMTAVLEAVDAAGPDPDDLVVLAAVCAPEGLERVGQAVPAADLVTVAVDDGLDENGFIVPGLGDAGDRAYGGTE